MTKNSSRWLLPIITGIIVFGYLTICLTHSNSKRSVSAHQAVKH